MWDDIVNPLNDWWEAYTPSEESVEAAALGFDFKDPQGWCEVRKVIAHVCNVVLTILTFL